MYVYKRTEHLISENKSKQYLVLLAKNILLVQNKKCRPKPRIR